MNWADDVAVWNGSIMNYGLYGNRELMTEGTTWWVTGPPDADADGNGNGWDYGIDLDHVAGWRNCGSDPDKPESITLHFNTALLDGENDDLKIVTYGGPYGEASVWASTDGIDYVQIGTVGAGDPGYFVDLWFDFSGELEGVGAYQIDDVHYIRLDREVFGARTGRFFDAIGGKYSAVPEPATATLLLSLAGFIAVWRWRCCPRCMKELKQ